MIKYLIVSSLIAASLQIPHCEETTKICKNCKDGYTLVKYNNEYTECIEAKTLKAIQEKLPNCISPNEDYTQCYSCERGYAWSSSQKACIQKTHCEELDENDKCKDCGYYAIDSDSGNCIEKPFCYIASGSKCKECFEYYYPDANGECKRIPFDHCLVGNSEKCSECDDYYYVVEGKCEKIKPGNCIRLKEDSTTECEKCDDYYYVNGGKCEKNPDYCSYYYENKCHYCKEGYYLLDGQCQPVTKVPNCDGYNREENKCYSCASPYYLDENECKIVTDQIPNCVYYSDADHCEECDSNNGYKLNEDGTNCEKYCDTEEICEDCEYNYLSFDYGKTCTILDSSLETNDGNRLNSLNFALVILLLFAL